MPISLDTPLAVVPPVYTITDYSFSVDPVQIIVKLNYKDQTGNIVVEKEIHITGSDYNDMANAVIGAGQVGQKYLTVIRRAIQTKVKNILGLSGTET